MDSVINKFDKNQEFYGGILKDEDFKMKLMELIMLENYAYFKKKNCMINNTRRLPPCVVFFILFIVDNSYKMV